MKYLHLVYILSVIAIAYAAELSKEDEEKLAKVLEECQKETNASIDDVKAIGNEEFPKTKTQYCLTACLYKKTGVMDDDNNINLEKALEDMAYLEEDDKKMHDNLAKIIKDCHPKYTPTKECDSIKTYFECITKAAKKEGIPVEK